MKILINAASGGMTSNIVITEAKGFWNHTHVCWKYRVSFHFRFVLPRSPSDELERKERWGEVSSQPPSLSSQTLSVMLTEKRKTLVKAKPQRNTTGRPPSVRVTETSHSRSQTFDPFSQRWVPDATINSLIQIWTEVFKRSSSELWLSHLSCSPIAVPSCF